MFSTLFWATSYTANDLHADLVNIQSRQIPLTLKITKNSKLCYKNFLLCLAARECNLEAIKKMISLGATADKMRADNSMIEMVIKLEPTFRLGTINGCYESTLLLVTYSPVDGDKIACIEELVKITPFYVIQEALFYRGILKQNLAICRALLSGNATQNASILNISPTYLSCAPYCHLSHPNLLHEAIMCCVNNLELFGTDFKIVRLFLERGGSSLSSYHKHHHAEDDTAPDERFLALSDYITPPTLAAMYRRPDIMHLLGLFAKNKKNTGAGSVFLALGQTNHYVDIVITNQDVETFRVLLEISNSSDNKIYLEKLLKTLLTENANVLSMISMLLARNRGCMDNRGSVNYLHRELAQRLLKRVFPLSQRTSILRGILPEDRTIVLDSTYSMDKRTLQEPSVLSNEINTAFSPISIQQCRDAKTTFESWRLMLALIVQELIVPTLIFPLMI